MKPASANQNVKYWHMPVMNDYVFASLSIVFYPRSSLRLNKYMSFNDIPNQRLPSLALLRRQIRMFVLSVEALRKIPQKLILV